MSKSVLISVFVGGLILILLSSVFIVDERQKGLVLQLDKLKQLKKIQD